MRLYQHPDECDVCKGSLLQMLTQAEPDGVTIGVRRCPNLSPASQTPVVEVPSTPVVAGCDKKHMLPGMDNKTLSEGGILCGMKFGHPGDCTIVIEQPTCSVRMSVDPKGENEPKVLSQTPKTVKKAK